MYADGFQQHKSMSDTRSVTGVYMMPLGLPLDRRRSSAATRVITLIPDGADERNVFNIIESDLVKAASQGCVAMDPYGNVVKVFIDVVSFFGDYPAVTAMADVRGHTATEFCTFWTMRKMDEACGRNLLYSSKYHGRRLGFMRFDERTDAIRSANPPDDLVQALGLSRQPPAYAANAPLVRYSRRIRELKEKGVRPPFSMSFDSCLNVAAAPDHLFTGLIADVMHVCLLSLQDDEKREQFEVKVIANAYANSLQHDGKFLKWKKNTCVGLHSMTMSTRVGLILCAVPLFDDEYKRTRDDVFMLPGKLQEVLSLVYHLPSEEADGPGAKEHLTDEGKLKMHGERCRAVGEYIALCRTLFRTNGKHSRVLNKPNVHRALELCILTIPSFGHARNCSEMVLESTHRSFKRWLETNTHGNAHITAVERTLLKDWLNRVHGLYLQCTKGDKEQEARAERGLLRLLVGKEALTMDRRRRGAAEFVRDFHSAMEQAFRDPFLREMPSTDQWGDPGGGQYAWELTEDEVERQEPSAAVQDGMKLLEDWYTCNGLDDVEVFECRTAKYMATDSVTKVRRSYAYNNVTSGCAVSVVCRRQRSSATLTRGARMGEEQCTVRFYAVFAVVRASNGDNWCIVKELSRTGAGYSLGGSGVGILQLGRRVRRVCVIHACDESCRVNTERTNVTHSTTLLRGGVFHIITRSGGYPPHLG